MDYIVKIIIRLTKNAAKFSVKFFPNLITSLLFWGEPDFSEITQLYEQERQHQ